jgi:hypothetical protein
MPPDETKYFKKNKLEKNFLRTLEIFKIQVIIYILSALDD